METNDLTAYRKNDWRWRLPLAERCSIGARALPAIGGCSAGLIGVLLLGSHLAAPLGLPSLSAPSQSDPQVVIAKPATSPEVPPPPTPGIEPAIEPRVASLAGAGLAVPPVRPAPLLAPLSDLALDELPPIEWIPSPFHRLRRQPITTLVMHTTGGSLKATIAEFQNSARWVSAHYVVSREGRVIQMVKEDQVAYHAGIVTAGPGSRFAGTNPNLYSIGIEIENPSIIRRPGDFPAAQKAAVFALARDIVQRNGIAIDRNHLVGHAEINPGSREDPGPGFPWPELLAYLAL